jgi:septal ring factor EnvC (AmiA/AmiB activator)
MDILLAQAEAKIYNFGMSSSRTVTNEDILAVLSNLVREVHDVAENQHDIMQMMSEGLDKLDIQLEGVKERLDGNEGGTRELKGDVRELKTASYRHEAELGKQTRLIESTRDEVSVIHVDLNEILHRIAALERKEKLNDKEKAEAQVKLQQVIDWAKVAAKQIGVPINLA